MLDYVAHGSRTAGSPAPSVPERVEHVAGSAMAMGGDGARWVLGASGVVRSDILVAGNTPQHLARTWEVTRLTFGWADALYPVAQHAMQRGYYMPNRNSSIAAGINVPTGAAARTSVAGGGMSVCAYMWRF